MRALNHQEPDRVPVDFGSTRASVIAWEAYERLKSHLGIDSQTVFMDRTSGRALPDESILKHFDIDTRMLPAQPPVVRLESEKLPAAFKDQWGVGWHLTDDGRYYADQSPFAGEPTPGDLRRHPWPDPDDPRLTTGLATRARELRESTDCAIVLGLPGRAFSQCQYLCGFEGWLMNLVANIRFAEALLDKVVEIEAQMIQNMLKVVGDLVDVVLCPDDLGMQSNLLISPRTYRQIVKPRHRRLFATIRRHTDAKLLLHSDGAIASVIGDLIDIGVEVINPVQVSAAGLGDTAWLKKEYGNDVSFWGAIDTQHVLPFGSPEDVREEVKRRIEDLAPGGGYVLASVHTIQAEVPPENICAMFQAAREFGGYDRSVGPHDGSSHKE
jgi:uroporphyrinogen decarboxylase